VVEVAMSVQFDELTAFTPAHIGLLWQIWKERYPETAYKAPLQSVVELFGTRAPRAELVMGGSEFPVGRTWYKSADGHRLVQVQPDKFVLNWRKLDTKTEYPSYDALRAVFYDELGAFLDFLADHEIGQFSATQAELTYVNQIVIEGLTGAGLSQYLAPWSGEQSERYLPDEEGARLSWQYRIDDQGKPIGRLHVQAQTGTRAADGRNVLSFQLIGRGAPTSGGVDGVLDFTDKAHEWIVRGFTSLTTKYAHTLWERTE
jgi:uncharacterized protein (TIGR04255 family)